MDVGLAFKQFLIDNNVYDEYNMYAHIRPAETFKHVCWSRLRNIINIALTWARTPSGQGRWNVLSHEWDTIVTSYLRSRTSVIKDVGTHTRLNQYSKMYAETNNSNINGLKELLPNFYLGSNSQQLILDNLKNRCHELKQGDFILDLDADQRAVYKLNLNADIDIGYKKYIQTINSALYDSYDTCGCSECTKYDYLINYDVWKSGKVKVKNQEVKLFKHLKSLGMSQHHIEALTTERCNNQLYFIISRNPVDYLFCSTNQSFGSCLNLESDYDGAFYMNLPSTFVDNNRFMVFITNGKLKTYTTKDTTFRHFSVIARTWGIFNDLNEVFIDNIYPHSAGFNFHGLLTSVTGLSTNYSGTSLFHSPIIFNTEGDRTMVYLDNSKVVKCSDNTYTYAPTGDGGSKFSTTEYDYEGGFNDLNSFNELCGRGRSVCPRCGGGCRREDGYTVQDEIEWVCVNCLIAIYSRCRYCGDYFRSVELTIIEGEHRCESCEEQLKE